MPNFIMLVGIPAVGKDTWAREYIEKHPYTVIHSSDDIREELYGDASHQGSPIKVFEQMRSRTLRDLRAGKDVIYNATNIKYKDRKSILSQLKKIDNLTCYCKIFVAPVEVCKERNAKRDRAVPDFVYDRMLKSFQVPFYEEGFASIEVIKTWDGSELEYMKEIIKKVKAFGDQKNPHHTLSLWEHCQECGRLALEKDYFAIPCYFHDFGKVFTQTFDEEGIAHYYGHESWGAYLVLCFGYHHCVAEVVCYHMMPYDYKGGKEVWKERFGPHLWEKLEHIHECDVGAR